jgi:hypothetical protein
MVRRGQLGPLAFPRINSKRPYTSLSLLFRNLPSNYYNFSYSFGSPTTSVQFVFIDTIELCGNARDALNGTQPPGPKDPATAERQWHWLNHTLRHARLAQDPTNAGLQLFNKDRALTGPVIIIMCSSSGTIQCFPWRTTGRPTV